VNGLKVGVVLAIGLAITAAWAEEGGDQYPNGAENWYAGAVPPPGHYYVNYFGFYTGKLKDGSGASAQVNGTTPSVFATFNASRIVEMTHFRLFGADYGMHVIVPVVYQSVDLNGTADKTDVGDLTVDPFVFAWHHPQWHAVAAMDVFLPTGYYDKNDARVSIGANRYGFEPLFGASWLPKSGWEASAKLMYDFTTTNQATEYHSGQAFHMDYAAGKHVGSWMAGGTGYFLKQTTDDTTAGQVTAAAPGLWDTGRRGQALAIGPSVGYTNKRHIVFMTDWQHETLVRNRFGGDKVWFKVIVPVDGVFRRASAK
jgi:hypothetical protein